MDILHQNYEKLKTILAGTDGVAVAFSGGVDSALLLYAAKEVLGEKAVAVTASIHSFPERELRDAVEFCRARGIRQIICRIDELEIEGFRENPPDRCYICKRALFTKMIGEAEKEGFSVVAEGSNTDDTGDYRPGARAIRELGVASPLREAGLSKQMIRDLSEEFGLPTWDKPSYACLATRFVYGETITVEKLRMVERAEDLLLGLGFRQMRVRIHGDSTARIEVPEKDIPELVARRDEIVPRFREIGFLYTAADLAGYRTGSMNDALRTGK